MEAVLINSAQAKSVETTLLRNQLSTPIEATLNNVRFARNIPFVCGDTSNSTYVVKKKKETKENIEDM